LAAFLLLAAGLAVPLQRSEARQPSRSPLFLALGDSLAFGVGADSPQDDGYIALTVEALRGGRFAQSGLDLVNLSAPGAETADLLEPGGQLERAIEEIHTRSEDGAPGNEVSLISISVGANDLLALADPGDPCIENAGSEECRNAVTGTLTNVQTNLAELLTALREAAPAAEIYVTNLYNPYSGTGHKFEIIASVGVQQLNGVIGVATAPQPLRVKLVPIFELFQGRAKQWIAQDEIHPNNDGYRVIAAALLAAIENRPVAIPEDLQALPTEAPVATVVNNSGVDPVLFWIALAVVFTAGASLSAAYFLMRGRA
jgi:lysophospholipase L1-like esterase